MVYSKLRHEIHSAFDTYRAINAESTADLQYLHAVALEGMRMYAPLPFALPRVVPEGGDTVDNHFLPAGVCEFGSEARRPADRPDNCID